MSDTPEATVVKKNKGGRPKKADAIASVLASPEGQEAISAAVAAVLSRLNLERAGANTQPQDGDTSFARSLAGAIAEISDQGNKVRRVAPAEMERRKVARQTMESMLIEARANRVVPEYELNATVYLDEVLVAPTYIDRNHVTRRTQIAWANVPNEQMSPINAAARNIHRAFMESIGGATQVVKREDDVLVDNEPETVGLRVLHQDGLRKEVAQVGKPRHQDLKILSRNAPGDITETNVLGSIAAPARQIT